MMSDITNSIKAKLYDFTYTPFMSSVVISWIVLNHKYLLIYSGDSKLNEKLTRLNEYDFSASVFGLAVPYAMNIWFPLAFGLFYVFAYPWVSKIFYEYTLKRTKALKKIKQKIEDETPITQEEARQIRNDIEQLTKERDEYRDKAIQAEKRYEKQYQDRIKELESIEEISTTEDEVIKDTDSQTPILHADVPNISKESDKTKVLRFFYESNYTPSYETNTLNSIVSSTKIPRPKASKILDELVLDKILDRSKDSLKTITITSKGNDKLIEMFDEEELAR